MPWGLKRFQQTRQVHFITFSCYRRRPYLNHDAARKLFPEALETRAAGLCSLRLRLCCHAGTCSSAGERAAAQQLGAGYQVAEAGRCPTAGAARRRPVLASALFPPHRVAVNVADLLYEFSLAPHIEIVILVAKPEDWSWSSFRHYATGEDAVVEIESQWTARKRERLGIFPALRLPL